MRRPRPGASGWLRYARLSALLIALVAPGMATSPSVADAASTTDIRVSVKVILVPGTHRRPPIDASGLVVNNLRILVALQDANDSLQAHYWRGYRFKVTEILDIGSCASGCDSSDPTFWSGNPFPDGYGMKEFEQLAKKTPAFQWRTNAVNIYINEGKGNGAVASFPPPDPRSNDVVFVGSRVFDPQFSRSFAGGIIHHELGHYFNLPHPNGSLESCCNPASCITDGDQIEDTLPDGPCFTLDQLSLHRYGTVFAGVSATRQDSLLNVFWNNMAYLHPDQKDDRGEGYGHTFLSRLTELQLDRWTDAANGVRASVRSARTRFVEAIAPCPPCPPPTGSSTDPYHGIPQAMAGAAPGDVFLLRPGTYTGLLVYNQPATYRATRRGPARLTN